MKVNFDSIIYIIITAVVLIISGLGRRKKRMSQMNAASTANSRESEGMDEEVYLANLQPSVNPLQRIEQLLSGQISPYVSKEGETLETAMDEEELIMEEIQKDREELQLSKEESIQGLYNNKAEIINEINPENEIQTEQIREISPLGLFCDLNEIKKAVIYSEIMNRKYE